MKIDTNRGIIIAKELLSKVRQKTRDIKGSMSVNTYKNGRENGYGFTILLRRPKPYTKINENAIDGSLASRDAVMDTTETATTTGITFWIAENRNSDHIVIYEDPMWYGDGLSDVGYYRGAKYFNYNEREKAATFISNKLHEYEKKYDIM